MKFTQSPKLFLAVALVWPFAAIGQDNNELGIEGKVVAETIFQSLDDAEDGKIHMGDIEAYRDSVFAGMDSDTNGKVIYDEFSAWDPGFVFVAEEVGRKDAYTTASKIVFAFWDRNGDGELTDREMRLSMSADFRRADLDDDGFLTQDEFIAGFPIIVAMRAAIRPDL